jgi:hypothetical protein
MVVIDVSNSASKGKAQYCCAPTFVKVAKVLHEVKENVGACHEVFLTFVFCIPNLIIEPNITLSTNLLLDRVS